VSRVNGGGLCQSKFEDDAAAITFWSIDSIPCIGVFTCAASWASSWCIRLSSAAWCSLRVLLVKIRARDCARMRCLCTPGPLTMLLLLSAFAIYDMARRSDCTLHKAYCRRSGSFVFDIVRRRSRPIFSWAASLRPRKARSCLALRWVALRLLLLLAI